MDHGSLILKDLAVRVSRNLSAQLLYARGVKWLTGEWLIDRTDARQRRIIHYWLTIFWLTIGAALWLLLRDALWFVGFMSLYAIWISHIAGWAAETPVESQDS